MNLQIRLRISYNLLWNISKLCQPFIFSERIIERNHDFNDITNVVYMKKKTSIKNKFNVYFKLTLFIFEKLIQIE